MSPFCFLDTLCISERIKSPAIEVQMCLPPWVHYNYNYHHLLFLADFSPINVTCGEICYCRQKSKSGIWCEECALCCFMQKSILMFFQTNKVTKNFYCLFYYLGFLVVAFTVVKVLAVVTFVEEAFLNFFSS